MVTRAQPDRRIMQQSRPFLTAEWRHLAMLNYEIDPAALEPFVPAGTEIDLFEGRCYVSLVGFLFLDTRILGLPLPLHRNFEELNLRFYVQRPAPGEPRRGVVFIKEIVPRRAVATVARLAYGENYVALPMSHEIHGEAAPDVTYRWRVEGRDDSMRIATRGVAALPGRGSEEEFITEHYWGYSARSGGTTTEYAVEHPPWRVWSAAETRLECDVASLYGDAFAESLDQPPASAFLAEGSPVTVFRGRDIVD